MESSRKGFGIAALVRATVAFFVPIVALIIGDKETANAPGAAL